MLVLGIHVFVQWYIYGKLTYVIKSKRWHRKKASFLTEPIDNDLFVKGEFFFFVGISVDNRMLGKVVRLMSHKSAEVEEDFFSFSFTV